MAPRTDFLTKQRQQIEARLKELRPAHEEYLTLLKARDALGGREARERASRSGPAAGQPHRQARAGPAARQPHRARAARRRRTGGAHVSAAARRRSNTRADQALALIKAEPRHQRCPTSPSRMGIRQNYLYRVTAGAGEAASRPAPRRRVSRRLTEYPASQSDWLTGVAGDQAVTPAFIFSMIASATSEVPTAVGSSRVGFMS